MADPDSRGYDKAWVCRPSFKLFAVKIHNVQGAMLSEDKALQTSENTDDCDKGRVDGNKGRLGRVMVDLEIGSS